MGKGVMVVYYQITQLYVNVSFDNKHRKCPSRANQPSTMALEIWELPKQSFRGNGFESKRTRPPESNRAAQTVRKSKNPDEFYRADMYLLVNALFSPNFSTEK